MFRFPFVIFAIRLRVESFLMLVVDDIDTFSSGLVVLGHLGLALGPIMARFTALEADLFLGWVAVSARCWLVIVAIISRASLVSLVLRVQLVVATGPGSKVLHSLGLTIVKVALSQEVGLQASEPLD